MSSAYGGNAHASAKRAVALGWGSVASGMNSSAIGNGANTGVDAVGATAIGSGAVVGPNATNAVQIGYGRNNDAGTVQFMDRKLAFADQISHTDPGFSNEVLSVGIDTNVLVTVAQIQSLGTNTVAQIGDFVSAFSDIGLTLPQGGLSIAGLLAALVAAVTWLKRNKASKDDLPYMTKVGEGRYEYTGALVDASTRTYPREES